MSRLSPSALLLLLAISSSVLAQEADSQASGAAADEQQVKVERLTGPIPEQVASYEETRDRYVTRLGEFRTDAQDFIDLVEQQKRRQIVDGYGRMIASLRDEEEALRTLAKARFEDFLLKYPSSEASPHVMFRLAELYYEDSENNFLVADANYNDRLIEYDEMLQELMASSDPAAFDTLPDPPEPALKDYSKSLSLYNRIVDGYPRYDNIDGVHYMLGYCLTEENALYPDAPKGLASMQTLVDSFPNSEFVNDGSMRLGEYYFNEANDLEQAIVHYQRIVDSGEDARYYDKGLYKLAWSHYRLASIERLEEYDTAMLLFVQLLDYSDRLMLSTGVQSAMKPEAIDYAAISFADMGDHHKIPPLQVAEEFFQGVGERDYEQDIYIKLADVLTRQARYDEAIGAYEYLQTRWPDNPENPEFQFKVAQLYMSLPVPDPVASADAERLLAERYNDSTEWWSANRANPDALAVARGYTERSTANVAKDMHLAAQETGDPKQFSDAADKYREYLLRFPFADDYYEMEWYLADALFNAKRFEDAEKEFLQLLKTDAHPYGDGSLFKLMQTRRQQLVDKYGEVKARPDNALVERVDKTDYGAEIQVYMITDDHKSFIEIADQIVETPFTDPTYIGPRKENLSALHYLPAQIFFEFGHYDDALERFNEMVELYPNSKESAFAGGLILRIWQERNDLAMVNSETKRLQGVFEASAVAQAEDSEMMEMLSQWQDLEEGTAFKLANQLAKAGKREDAADAFRRFCEDYPKSVHYKDAFFNWANNLELVGRVDESITLFEQFINEFPKDDRSKGFYFRIAGNYAQILELETAIGYYDRLVKNFPKDDNAPAAVYNAAFLRIGVGDHQGAARGLERYATGWPDNEDAEKAFFLAGNEWEQVGERQALDFYRRYLRQYGGQDVNHTLTAQYKIIKLLEGMGQARNAEREWVEIEKMFVEFVEAGEEIAGPGRNAAAEGSFPALWEQYEAFRDVTFTGDQEKDAPMLINEKPEQLKALADACLEFIKKYQDFTYSSAALYVQAAAHFDYAQMLFDAPPPKGFNQEMIDIYVGELDKLRVPVEEKGKALATRLLQQAEKDERWSEWQSKTIDLLNQRFPKEFPAEKIEARYQTEPQVMRGLDVIDIDVGGPEPEPEPEPAPTPAPAPATPEPATPVPTTPPPTEGGE